jgi:uncharacterized YigZ family protein
MTDATEPYHTVAERTSVGFEIQGSEFIGHVTPTVSVAAAESFVEAMEAEYDDATHTVPAYRVRAGRDGALLREYQSDAGEPGGSAGKPALNVLQGRELENVTAVVARYYGGTNLGIGGLVSAYGRAVSEAVDTAGTVERRPHESLTVVVAYDDSGTVRGILESSDGQFEASYEAEVTFEVRVPVETADALRDRLRSATSGRVSIEE